MMLDHVTVNVGDFEQAKRFYEQALAPLGYSVQMEFAGAAGFGTGAGIPDFWIGSSPDSGGWDGQRRSRPAPALSRELLRGLRPRRGRQQRRGRVPPARLMVECIRVII